MGLEIYSESRSEHYLLKIRVNVVFLEKSFVDLELDVINMLITSSSVSLYPNTWRCWRGLEPLPDCGSSDG